MSKIGKKSITVPAGVTVNVAGSTVAVKGPKGEEKVEMHPKVLVEIAGTDLKVSVKNPNDRRQKALWGTFRSLIANAITGVTSGYEKKLDIIGVGYKAAVASGKLTLNLGYSHPIEMLVPKGIDVKVEK